NHRTGNAIEEHLGAADGGGHHARAIELQAHRCRWPESRAEDRDDLAGREHVGRVVGGTRNRTDCRRGRGDNVVGEKPINDHGVFVGRGIYPAVGHGGTYEFGDRAHLVSSVHVAVPELVGEIVGVVCVQRGGGGKVVIVAGDLPEDAGAILSAVGG